MKKKIRKYEVYIREKIDNYISIFRVHDIYSDEIGEI